MSHPLHASAVAPILCAREVDAALERMARLGFETRRFRDPHGAVIYGFARAGAVELHLTRVPDLEPLRSTSACYLYVADVDAVYAGWSSAGVEGRFHPPTDTRYGLREMAYVDPDGNLLRVGSPLRADTD